MAHDPVNVTISGGITPVQSEHNPRVWNIPADSGGAPHASFILNPAEAAAWAAAFANAEYPNPNTKVTETPA